MNRHIDAAYRWRGFYASCCGILSPRHLTFGASMSIDFGNKYWGLWLSLNLGPFSVSAGYDYTPGYSDGDEDDECMDDPEQWE